MSKKKTIVKSLDSIQSFGAMNVLCTDKTGTLTEDKIVLEKYGNHQLEVDGQILTQLPVRLAVIGADGRVLADLDTGMEVPPYGKFVFIPVEVQPEGERVAIRCPQEDKSVQVELPA